jgi:lipoyl(octanoyl) transferase
MIALIEIPRMEYTRCLELQKDLVNKKIRDRSFPDVLILVEHDPVITLGKRSANKEILLSQRELEIRNIPVVRTGRGGLATYHGPGQVVGYPIMDLRRSRMRIREYVERLEGLMLSAAGKLGVEGRIIPGKVGLWLKDGSKVGAIGAQISKGVTFHGFSLNIAPDRDPGELVVSCGMPKVKTGAVSEALGATVRMEEALGAIRESFEELFGTELKSFSIDELII